MDPLRVLIISHTYLPTGYRGKLRHLAARPDLQIRLLAVPWLQRSGQHLDYERAATDSYPQHLVRALFQSHNILRMYAPGPLVRVLREMQPHIVHIEAEPHALALTQVILLRSLSPYRILFFTWENIYRRLGAPLRWIESFNLRRADAALAGNGEAARVLRQRGFLGPATVVPQVGIDPAAWAEAMPAPAYAALRQRGPVVGFVGRLVAEKGILDLLAAFATLPRSLPAQLLIVGAGPLEGEVRDRAGQPDIDGRVHLAGFVRFGEMPSYLRCMDVMVLPSRTALQWKEQFGHVLVEAMAAGVPVIGSDSGAIPEVIGDAGMIYPEGDVAALGAALADLLRDPVLRQQIGQRGVLRVHARYSDEALAERTYQVYRRLVGR